MIQSLTDAQMLTIWDRGLALGSTDRALLALSIAEPQTSIGELRAWPLAQRDARLMGLRIAAMGRSANFSVCCDQCRAQLEFACDLEALSTQAADPPRELHLVLGDLDVHVRLPDSDDASALERAGSVVEGEKILWRRCVKVRSTDGRDLDPADLTVQQRDEIEARVAETHPLLDLHFELTCAECGTNWSSPCDLAQMFWAELAQLARNTLLQIDALARRYGWTESEVLALSRARREMYLALGA